MKVRLFAEAEAQALLGRDDFVRDWDALLRGCPWATGFQASGFARAWYSSYTETHAPLLAVSQEGEGRLAGLLALARERASGQLVTVGAHQSEYHGWLALPDAGETFIVRALQALRAAFPGSALRFRYLPPGAPVQWLERDPEMARLAEVRSVPRPLLRIEDGEREFAERMRKKSNKSRLNRLRKACGAELAGGGITTEHELAAVMDEIARNYDERQGNANATRPFAEDPRKRDFHLRLFREGLLHGHVLRAGNRFVAAVLSVPSRGVLSVGVFAHSNELADYSPGKFGMAWLARDAAQEGFGTIDLTPGGDWKDRFANDRDEVLDLTVRFCPRAARRNARRRSVERAAKTVLSGIGIEPQTLRRLRERARVLCR